MHLKKVQHGIIVSMSANHVELLINHSRDATDAGMRHWGQHHPFAVEGSSCSAELSSLSLSTLKPTATIR